MDTTDRFHLPLLAAGQMQKEIWHNEALATLDLVLGGTIEGAAAATPPATPRAGSLYLVASGASGAWAGHDGQLAAWLASGWRFIVPAEGLCLTERLTDLEWRRTASGWSTGQINANQLVIGGLQVVGARGAPIAAVSGGTTIDAEARACLTSILSALRTHGLLET